MTFILFLSLGKLTPEKLATLEPRFERQAVILYAIAGLSTVIVCLPIDLGGPALAGLFAMLPWAVLGWKNFWMVKL